MALSYGFFNAELVGDEYDRVYAAEEFAEYFSLFIKNGVFPTPATQMQVIAHNPANMQVVVDDGYGWINGYYAKNDGDYPLNIATASGTQPRIDSVVLRWNKSTRNIELAVKTGTAAASPVAPAPTRNADVYELVLAQVRVNAGVTAITQSAITDTRPNNNLCGWVTGVVDQIDTTNLFAQYNATFTEWFNNIQAQLSGNVATNLQNQIDTLIQKTTLTADTKTKLGLTGDPSMDSAFSALASRYGTCSTAAATKAKVVTLSGFTLATGAVIAVKFTYANTASSPTLNVNGTGAKSIAVYGSTAAGSGAWSAGEVVLFVYDGTRWVMNSGAILGTGSGCEIYTGTYTGDGAKVKTLTFPKTPVYLRIQRISSGRLSNTLGLNYVSEVADNAYFNNDSPYGSDYYNILNVSGKTLTITESGEINHTVNANNVVYYYLALAHSDGTSFV